LALGVGVRKAVVVIISELKDLAVMLKSVRYRACACGLLGSALLSGCGAPPPAVSTAALSSQLSAATPAGKPAFTLDTPVNRIAADPNGKAILDRDVPGLMASKEYPLFDDMSLSQIAIMSGGKLTKVKLNLVQSDLVEMSDASP
jgi:hypothetical protein